MTQTPETRFRCDRCFTEQSVPMNDQPAQQRGKAPNGWLALHLFEVGAPPWHLCTECSGKFQAFMRECGGE